MSTQRLLLLLGISILLNACVTVKLDKGEEELKTKASNYSFNIPNNSFSKQTSKDLDHLWINSKNGNSISILSTCDASSEQSLKQIQRDILTRLDEWKILNTSFVDFNKRKALRTLVTSNMDGYDTSLDIVVFKKSNCVYVLNYVANTKAFKENKQQYNNFLAHFRIN